MAPSSPTQAELQQTLRRNGLVQFGQDEIDLLRRPFTPEAIKWKVQATGPKNKPKTWAMVVPYIDARLVIERLDHVVPGRWQDATEPVPGNASAMICRLTVVGQTRSDVGESPHSLKAAASDALKRTAVRFGIGASIYAMNRVMLDVTDTGEMKNDRPTLKRKGDSAELTPQVEAWLREKYGAWLKTVEDRFGAPLDHGDTSETLGLEGADARPPDQEDPELDAKIAEVRGLFDNLTAEQRKKRPALTPAKFRAQLTDASESAEGLSRLEAELKERAS